MAYSAATYKGDGSQSTFIIPFDYLQKDFVKVTINEVDKVYAQDYNVDGRELSFPTAPPSGSIIKVYRETPTDRMVKWNEGSVLTSSNMTTQQIQELHLIEEATYNLEDSAMLKTEDGHKWEGQYLPIIHVGDPIDDSDVVNLGTIKKEETGFLASVRSQLDKWLADLGVTYNSYSKSLKESFDSYVSSLKNQFDTHTASLLSDFNDYKDTLKANYDNYTSTLLNNFNDYNTTLKNTYDTYTSNLSTTFNGYKTTLLNKYNEYLASLTATKDAVKDSEANASKYKDEAKSASASAKESANQCADSVVTCTTRVTEANQAKESASASANTATTKAIESGNSASLSKKWAVSTESPDGAVGSKSAKTWAEEAKSSEQKATTSANNAKASENNAKTSEGNAKASETASANSANASAKSATAAKGSEDKAKTSEVNAKASEVAAAESAKQAAAGQINADWNVTDTESKAFVKNKPSIKLYGTQNVSASLTINPTASNYNSGLRLNQGSDNWATIYLGAGLNTMSGSNEHAWGISRDPSYALGIWPNDVSNKGKKGLYLPLNGRATLDGKTVIVEGDTVGKATSDAAGNNIQNTYAKKSDLSTSVSTTSLTVTGETSVPTANEGNSSNTIASTEFVAKSLAKMVDSAPESLNTLNELAKALGNDPNFATTVINELGKKMNEKEATDTFLPKTVAESTFAKKEEAGVLSGTVMAFSGTFKDGYPIDKKTGLSDNKWHLCDGTNGTPDLRNCFIYGGDGTNNGATGGEASVTLNVSNIPSHGHMIRTWNDAASGYPLVYRNGSWERWTGGYFRVTGGWQKPAGNTATAPQNGQGDPAGTTDGTGGNQPHNNMPPYYVLAYIMKL